jgi:hypothetical protein
MTQQLFQTVTCSQVCDVTTTVSITLKDARSLGYKTSGSSTSPVTVASSYVRLKANTPTNVGFVLSTDGRRLLPKAKSGLQILGKLTAFAKASRTVHGSAAWRIVLK